MPDWTDQFPPLKRLSAGALSRLVQAGTIVELPEGSRNFGPGQAPESFMLLLEGTIRVQPGVPLTHPMPHWTVLAA